MRQDQKEPNEKEAGLLCVTDVVVGHPLQQAGLVASRRRPDAGGQHAEVALMDVQREICRRAQFDLRAALVVL